MKKQMSVFVALFAAIAIAVGAPAHTNAWSSLQVTGPTASLKNSATEVAYELSVLEEISEKLGGTSDASWTWSLKVETVQDKIAALIAAMPEGCATAVGIQDTLEIAGEVGVESVSVIEDALLESISKMRVGAFQKSALVLQVESATDALYESFDAVGEMSSMTTIQLQSLMSNRAMIIQTLSNMLSSASDSQSSILGNLK